MNFDEMLAEHHKKEAALAAALEAFNADQAAGRIGLEAYQRAKRLSEELTTLGSAIALKIDEALAAI